MFGTLVCVRCNYEFQLLELAAEHVSCHSRWMRNASGLEYVAPNDILDEGACYLGVRVPCGLPPDHTMNIFDDFVVRKHAEQT